LIRDRGFIQAFQQPIEIDEIADDVTGPFVEQSIAARSIADSDKRQSEAPSRPRIPNGVAN